MMRSFLFVRRKLCQRARVRLGVFFTMGNIGRFIWSTGPVLCVLTVMLSSGHFIAGRIAGDTLEVRPFQLAFFRFFSATMILSGFMAVTWFTGRRETIKNDLRLIAQHWWKLADLV